MSKNLVRDRRRAMRTAGLSSILAVLACAGPAAAATELSGTLYELSDESLILVDGDRTIPVSLSGEPPQSGSSVTVSGEHGNAGFVVDELTVTTDAVSTSAVGRRDAIVLRIAFPEREAPSDEQVRSAVFTSPGSVAAFIDEASYGQTKIAGHRFGAVGDVAGPFTVVQRLDVETTECNHERWGDEARAQATAAGWDLSAYEHVIHWFPRVAACPWAGVGAIGGPYTWINGPGVLGSNSPQTGDAQVVTHEIGHNLGLYHANAVLCRNSAGHPVALSASCERIGYGDPVDIMGRGVNHFQAHGKGSLGWLRPGNMSTATASGSYAVAPVGTPTDAIQDLRIDAPLAKRHKKGTIQEYLSVEYRQPAPLFESFGGFHHNGAKGAIIRLTPDYADGHTHLIDTTPGSLPISPVEEWPGLMRSPAGFRDAALLPGRGFYDPLRKVLIRTLEATATGVRVDVRFSWEDSAPTAQAGTAHGMTSGERHTHSGAQATDPDSDLASFAWQFVSCPGTICPSFEDGSESGALFGGDAAVPGPTFTPPQPGEYVLRLTVRDGAGNTATALLTEQAG